MRLWWRSLQPRERWLLIGAAILTAALLFYALLWQPLSISLGQLRVGVSAQHADLDWMYQTARQVGRAATAAQSPTSRPGRESARSLLTIVDQTARDGGIGSSVRRVEPQGEDQASVRLEEVAFDELVDWLNRLGEEHGIQIDNAIVERHDLNGHVNARLILQGTAP